MHDEDQYCRSRADQRFGTRLRKLEKALKDNGWNGRCWFRPIDEGDSVYWPPREVAILVEIADFETDARYIEDTIAIRQDLFGNDWRFKVVPVINDYVVPALALLPSAEVPLPDHNFAKDWQEHIDRPFSSPQFVGSFDEAMAACTQLSGILVCCDLENLHPDENEAIALAIEDFERKHNLVAEAPETIGSEYLTLAYNYLDQTWEQVVGEFESAKAGQPIAEPLCMNDYLTLSGHISDHSTELASVRILLIQTECNGKAESGDGMPSRGS